MLLLSSLLSLNRYKLKLGLCQGFTSNRKTAANQNLE